MYTVQHRKKNFETTTKNEDLFQFFFIINVRQKSHRPSPRYKNNGGPVGS